MLSPVYSFGVTIIIFIFFSKIQARNVYNGQKSKSFLSSLLSEAKQEDGPIILILDNVVPDESDSSSEDLADLRTTQVKTTDEAEAKNDKPAISEDDAYQLYGILRTAQHEEQLNDEEERDIEKTKDMLRMVFRSRCQKKNDCEVKCPPKKKACKSRCEQVFDELLACPPPKQDNCGKKKDNCGRGRTMPPKWLLRTILKIGS